MLSTFSNIDKCVVPNKCGIWFLIQVRANSLNGHFSVCPPPPLCYNHECRSSTSHSKINSNDINAILKTSMMRNKSEHTSIGRNLKTGPLIGPQSNHSELSDLYHLSGWNPAIGWCHRMYAVYPVGIRCFHARSPVLMGILLPADSYRRAVKRRIGLLTTKEFH